MKRFAKVLLIAGSVLWIHATLSPHALTANSGFVSTSGRHLLLNGRPFYLAGANAYELAFQPQAVVDEILSDAAALGLNVIRTWAFCEGPKVNGFCFQPSPGVYDEATFRQLDYALFKANQLNLRVILPLVNNWDDFGGMNQYVAWCASGATHDDFYHTECTKTLYKNYVRQLLNRVNTYTGVRYRDDPTILLWELANEPRAQSDATGTTLFNWITEMAAFVQSIDPNHLVGTGEEGWYANKGSDWRHNGSQGADFLRNSQSAGIDVASFHLYPSHYALSDAEALGWIDEHVADAHQVVNKPVIVGEFGWPVPRQVLGDFSAGAETWRVDWAFDASSPQRTESPSHNGNGAIAYATTGTLPANASAAGERWLPSPGLDVLSYTSLSGWVYLPAGAPADIRAVLYTKSGAAWTWREGTYVTLTPGAWTRVTMDTRLIEQPAQVKSVGIKILTGVSGYTGSVFYDEITASSTAAGQTMADRERTYGDWFVRLDAADADSALLWRLSGHQPDTTFTSDTDHFAVYQPEDGSTTTGIRNYAARVAAKNGSPSADAPPSVAIQSPVSGTAVSGSVDVTASVADDHGVSGVTYAVDGGAAQAMVLAGGVWQAVWDSTTVADGSHTMRVTASDTSGQTAQQQVTVTTSNAPPAAPPAIFVSRIDLTLRSKGRNGIKKQAFATIAVVDQAGAPVGGVTVSTHWSGSTTDSDVTVTDSGGLAKNIASNEIQATSGWFQITVDALAKSGSTYEPSRNIETSDQISFYSFSF